MTNPHCDTCNNLLRMLESADIKFSPSERAVLLERAKKSIEESERVMLLRMPCSDRIH